MARISTATTPAGYLGELVASGEITQSDRQILIDYIDYRNTVRPTSRATQKKQAFHCAWICRVIRERGSSLETCTARDLLAVAARASNGYTHNTRQSKIAALKSLAKYVSRFHHSIKDLDMLDDVKTGCADKRRKTVLTVEEWEKVLNARMNARERAMMAMLYDGYHRPKEILILKWSDLRVNMSGRIEYEITFKTEKPRTIVQKGTTTAILEMWRQECCAAYGDETPIFSDRDGGAYQTTTVLRDLFARLRRQTGYQKLTPGSLRNTAITHDVEAGLPTSYICLRAWGESYNEMINIYARPESSRMQEELHEKEGMNAVKIDLIGRHTKNVILCPGCNISNPHNALYCYGCGRALTKEGIAAIESALSAARGRLDILERAVFDRQS